MGVSEGGRDLSWERTGVLTLCFVGAIRVFFFAAAFPFFNNVDEMAHLDLALRYAKGQIPAECRPAYDDASRVLIATYGSPEWYFGPGDYPDHAIPPPPWRRPGVEASRAVSGAMEVLRSYTNKEACSPPVYYLFAGLWLDLGRVLGIRAGGLIYWLRFLNVPNIVALVLLTRATVRRFFVKDRFLGIAAPALVAVFPQDTLYSINSDVLSPLLFGLAWLLLLRLCAEERSYAAHIVAGFVTAAAMLTKLSNFVLAPLVVVVLLLGRGGAGGRTLRPGRVGAFALAAAAPVLAWIARNQVLLSDPLATHVKTGSLGWTVKPLWERFQSSLLTRAGAWDFLTSTIETYWRGEFIWHRVSLSSSVLDATFVATTLLFVPAALILVAFSRGTGGASGGERTEDVGMGARRLALWAGAGALALFGLFLFWASLRFDYGTCPYPSRDRPYLRSGRLALGALVPFVVLYLEGMRAVLTRLRAGRFALIVALALAAAVLVSEAMIRAPAFPSEYNWFHLP